MSEIVGEDQNPRFGYQRIAHQLALALDIEIDKDVVRRVLAKLYRPDPQQRGLSWLTLLGHTKDSLWSVDFFRCESLSLKSHWVMVGMDLFTRRIVGFSVHPGVLDGPTICRMLSQVIKQADALPRILSSDNDPLFEFHRWKANLRILDVSKIKTVPYVPMSHPFIERLIGTVRRELLDHTPFWTSTDLDRKLAHFKHYYNRARTHRSLDGNTPVKSQKLVASIDSLKWSSYCRGLYELPIAA